MTKIEILNYLTTHKAELKEKFGVIRIGLFGSFARGEQNEDSDIDLAIEVEKDKKSLKNFFGLKRELEAQLGKKIDLGIESALKPLAKEQIQKDIIYV
jgi:predicted nucleotidyltransferase